MNKFIKQNKMYIMISIAIISIIGLFVYLSNDEEEGGFTLGVFGAAVSNCITYNKKGRGKCLCKRRNVNSSSDCQKLCQKYNGCKYFDYDKKNKYCFLRSSKGSSKSDSNWNTGPKYCSGSSGSSGCGLESKYDMGKGTSNCGVYFDGKSSDPCKKKGLKKDSRNRKCYKDTNGNCTYTQCCSSSGGKCSGGNGGSTSPSPGPSPGPSPSDGSFSTSGCKLQGHINFDDYSGGEDNLSDIEDFMKRFGKRDKFHDSIEDDDGDKRIIIKHDSSLGKKAMSVKLKKNDSDKKGDRTRIEWKSLEDKNDKWVAKKNSTMLYTYWMYIPSGYDASDGFNHVMQLKEVYKEDGDLKSSRGPIFTINLKGNRIIMKDGEDGDEPDLGSISKIRGKWVQVWIKCKYSSSSSSGYVDLKIVDKSGKIIVSKKKNYKTWPNSDIKWVRFKFGQYRKKEGVSRDETVKFSDFKIYKC